MKRTLIAGAAVLSLSFFTGCESPTKGPPPDGCKTSGGVCRVKITVTSGCTSASCVTLTPDSVHVGDGKGKVKDVNLLWKIGGTGYAFCDGDGIVFQGDPKGQFTDGYATNNDDATRDSAAGGKKNYQWKVANSVKGTFKYKVRFHDAKCAAAIEKDPDVVNEM
jgi:hypothetical protein